MPGMQLGYSAGYWGSGPPAGTRVVGLVKAGAWAQLAAIPTAWLAPVPDEVSDAQAATLPTAGMTALRSLEVAGLVLARPCERRPCQRAGARRRRSRRTAGPPRRL